MGSVQSEETQSMLSSLTQTINQTMNKVYNTTVLNCVAGGTLNVEFGVGCDFNAIGSNFTYVQNAQSTCQFSSENITQINETIKNTLTTTITDFINQNAKSSNGWFATALSFQIQGASTAEQISNLIVNSFQNNIINTCSAEIDALNNARLMICGTWTDSSIILSQNTVATATASCVNKQIVSIFTSNAILNNLYNQTNQATMSSNAGLESIIEYIIIGIVIIAIISSIAYVLYQPSNTTPTNSYGPPPYYPNNINRPFINNRPVVNNRPSGRIVNPTTNRVAIPAH